MTSKDNSLIANVSRDGGHSVPDGNHSVVDYTTYISA